MKKLLLVSAMLLSVSSMFSQSLKFIDEDIDRFWTALDKINSTTDSTLQARYLENIYLFKGSDGLKSLQKVRNYRTGDYIHAIRQYPSFWNSIRPSIDIRRKYYGAIEADIRKLKKLYPSLRPSPIYFLVGAFRTGATVDSNKILIGSEMQMGDSATAISELPAYLHNFYLQFAPRENLALTCTHEYIHTQQKHIIDNLLVYCLYEGVAEYVSCLATGKKSNTPAIAFGKQHTSQVVSKFLEDLYFGNPNNWLWGENRNELKMRDLGYYIGYEICERYYQKSQNKTQAIRELIDLDFQNDSEVEKIVDGSGLFPKTLQAMWNDYEKKRPLVAAVKPFLETNAVKPGLLQIDVNFSEEMDTTFRGFDFGPKGEDYVYEFKRILGWSADGKTFSYEVIVKPKRTYQFLITNGFRNRKGIRLKPFLVEFTTE